MRDKIKKGLVLGAALVLLLPSHARAGHGVYSRLEDNLLSQASVEKEQLNYISVKDFGKMVKKPVQWDGKNRAIYIGKKPSFNLGKEISLDDFIEEYNIYSKGSKTFGAYMEGFRDMEARYELNQDLGFKVLGKDIVARNVNLDDYIYPVYNEIAKVEFSLAVSSPTSYTNVLDGKKLEEKLSLEGGAPRIRALRKGENGYDYINLVSRINYKVDQATRPQPEKFELKLKDVYAMGLPKAGVDFKFTRNLDQVRVYLDGQRMNLTDEEGLSQSPLNINNQFYLPIRTIDQALKDDKSKKGLDPEAVFKQYGLGEYEKKIAPRIEKDKVYLYNPRSKEVLGLKNAVNIPDGDLRLNKKFSKIRGYHMAGGKVFSGNGKSPKPDDEMLNEKYNSGVIYNGNKLIYDSSILFEAKDAGENIAGLANKAKLKDYSPSNIIYFEVDVKNMDTIKFNNFNALNMEFVK